jgi:hypothetical protein
MPVYLPTPELPIYSQVPPAPTALSVSSYAAPPGGDSEISCPAPTEAVSQSSEPQRSTKEDFWNLFEVPTIIVRRGDRADEENGSNPSQ